VYGLGCDPRNNKAIRNLLELKHRPWQKGLILIAATIEQLYPFIDTDKFDLSGPRASWPGPVTWVVPAVAGVSHYLKGEHGSIAVRVTAHPLASLLCRTFHGPVVSTSANPAQHPPAVSAAGVRRYFGNDVDFVLDGPTGGLDRPTPIYDAQSGDVLRT
jgi:L-threonylcarbamoyladenylate synthase